MDEVFDRLKHLNSKDRAQNHAFIQPRDAASLIVIDRRFSPYKILMGLRHPKSSFMPSVYVYPGGALDISDIQLAQAQLKSFTPQQLKCSVISGRDPFGFEGYPAGEQFTYLSDKSLQRPAGIPENFDLPNRDRVTLSPTLVSQRELGAGLIYCALRELNEETGLDLTDISTPADFLFLSRAITPPGLKQRFDTRFFVYDYTGPPEWSEMGDNELTQTQWVSYKQALDLQTHVMTRVILEDLNDHLNRYGFVQPSSVAIYQYFGQKFQRDWIEMESPS